MKITSIKQQVRRRDRYSIFVDGIYAFSLSEAGLLSQGLAAGQEIDRLRLQELKDASGADKAYGNALRYVAMRPRSVWEMETYLRRKEVDEPVAVSIITRLQNVGLLDDRSFAQSWVHSRRLLKSMSHRKLRLELQQKQVPVSIIDQVLREDEGNDHTALREIIDKKRARYADDNKLIQYLARQGFNYDDIKNALSSLND